MVPTKKRTIASLMLCFSMLFGFKACYDRNFGSETETYNTPSPEVAQLNKVAKFLSSLSPEEQEIVTKVINKQSEADKEKLFAMFSDLAASEPSGEAMENPVRQLLVLSVGDKVEAIDRFMKVLLKHNCTSERLGKLLADLKQKKRQDPMVLEMLCALAGSTPNGPATQPDKLAEASIKFLSSLRAEEQEIVKKVLTQQSAEDKEKLFAMFSGLAASESTGKTMENPMRELLQLCGANKVAAIDRFMKVLLKNNRTPQKLGQLLADLKQKKTEDPMVLEMFCALAGSAPSNKDETPTKEQEQLQKLAAFVSRLSLEEQEMVTKAINKQSGEAKKKLFAMFSGLPVSASTSETMENPIRKLSRLCVGDKVEAFDRFIKVLLENELDAQQLGELVEDLSNDNDENPMIGKLVCALTGCAPDEPAEEEDNEERINAQTDLSAGEAMQTANNTQHKEAFTNPVSPKTLAHEEDLDPTPEPSNPPEPPTLKLPRGPFKDTRLKFANAKAAAKEEQKNGGSFLKACGVGFKAIVSSTPSKKKNKQATTPAEPSPPPTNLKELWTWTKKQASQLHRKKNQEDEILVIKPENNDSTQEQSQRLDDSQNGTDTVAGSEQETPTELDRSTTASLTGKELAAVEAEAEKKREDERKKAEAERCAPFKNNIIALSFWKDQVLLDIFLAQTKPNREKFVKAVRSTEKEIKGAKATLMCVLSCIQKNTDAKIINELISEPNNAFNKLKKQANAKLKTTLFWHRSTLEKFAAHLGAL